MPCVALVAGSNLMGVSSMCGPRTRLLKWSSDPTTTRPSSVSAGTWKAFTDRAVFEQLFFDYTVIDS